MKKVHSRTKNFGKGDWRSYFKLIPYIRLPWLLIAIAFVVDLTYSEVMAYVPVSTSALFSGEFTGTALASAIIYNVLNFGLMFGSLILSNWFSSIAVRRAQETLWGRMLRLDMAYYDTHNPADMMSTLTNDTEAAVKSLISQLVSFLPGIYYLVRVCKTLGSYDFRLLLSILILIPVNIIYVVVLGRWRYEVNVGIYSKIGKLTAFLAERVTNIYLIRSYTNEKEEEKKGLQAAGGLYDANMKAARVSFVASMASSFMELLQRGVPIIFGMVLLQNKYINMQQWIAFFLFTSQIFSRVNNVINLWSEVKGAQGAAARMLELFTAPKEPASRLSQKEEILNGDLVFDKVNFSYGEKQVIHDLDVVFPQGKTTAIVGRCGSGKTTLLSMIERLYVPTSGRITLAGKNIAEYDLPSYRDHFAYVQQDAGIFGGTIRQAMTYGIHRKVKEQELTEAAEKTGILSLVENAEDGFDAALSTSGASLSGGQRQRIVLGRELIKKKPVFLLDEPTSALDAVSALMIQQKILELFPGTTKIMIIHDLRMLSRVDHVVFMEKGRVADSGSHQDLMLRCEAYRMLVSCDEEVRA